MEIEPGLPLLKPPPALAICLSELAQIQTHVERHVQVFFKAASTRDKREPGDPEQVEGGSEHDAKRARR